MLRPMAWVVDMEEEAMEEDILPKFAVIVERQGIPLIHAIKSVVFHIISNLKIRTINQNHAAFHNTNFNN